MDALRRLLMAVTTEGGDDVKSGEFTPTEKTLTYGPIDTGADFDNIVLYAESSPYDGTGRTFAGVFVCYSEGSYFGVFSNAAGSSQSGVATYETHQPKTSMCGITKNGTTFSIDSGTGAGTGMVNYLKANIKYKWIAW